MLTKCLDSFYSGPLRGIFSQLRRSNILQDVQILSLDGLSVTAELIHDILSDPSFSVRILSIRDAKNLNERKLRGALQYACRDSRPDGTPRLKGFYVFGSKDHPPTPGGTPVIDKDGESEAWYVRRGNQISRRISSEWASTLAACDGIIAFDAVLCASPRHLNSPAWGSINLNALDAASDASLHDRRHHFSVATWGLDGCASCGSAPEGWTVWGENPQKTSRRDSFGETRSMAEIGRFPLLSPAPMHSADLRAAMCPSGQIINSRVPTFSATKRPKARFIPRCWSCLVDRYCMSCHRWWCENCFIGPRAAAYDAHGGVTGDLVSNPLPNDTRVVSGEDTREVRGGFCVLGECASA